MCDECVRTKVCAEARLAWECCRFVGRVLCSGRRWTGGRGHNLCDCMGCWGGGGLLKSSQHPSLLGQSLTPTDATEQPEMHHTPAPRSQSCSLPQWDATQGLGSQLYAAVAEKILTRKTPYRSPGVEHTCGFKDGFVRPPISPAFEHVFACI